MPGVTMNKAEQTRISKQLSFWLRHDPQAGGITLDEEGWAGVGAVLDALERTLLRPVSRDELAEVVAENDKQRFALDGDRIRARQGHSIDVAMDFRHVDPPDLLYHGTTEERWKKICGSGGLAKMQRQHVHLSPTPETATLVAQRHRREHPIVLTIHAGRMRESGHEFLLSENGVYLTNAVPLEFITMDE
jgi:putative RNA 2'-phosphotransferase